MPILKLSAAKSMHLISDHVLSRNRSNLTYSCLDLTKIPWGRNHGPLLTGVGRKGEGIIGSLPLKEGEGKKRGKRKGRC